jgi:hypothetical protein
MGYHFSRRVNAVDRAGRADALRSFDQQSARTAADIQDLLARPKVGQVECAPANFPLRGVPCKWSYRRSPAGYGFDSLGRGVGFRFLMGFVAVPTGNNPLGHG